MENILIDELDPENITNIQYNTVRPSDLTDDHFDCFKRKGLHFIHINARSLYPKLSELDIIAKKSRAAVIGVTESWLNESHTDESVKIEGYTLIRNDRQSHAGGVCAYIREDISYNRGSDLTTTDQENI